MSLQVITVEQMRHWEAASWKAGISEAEVIEQVGSILAKRALELTEFDDKILLIAGKGHNGDDVRAMATNLPDRNITLIDIIEPENSLEKLRASLSTKPQLVIDGLFGIGINRVLDKDWIDLFWKSTNDNCLYFQWMYLLESMLLPVRFKGLQFAPMKLLL